MEQKVPLQEAGQRSIPLKAAEIEQIPRRLSAGIKPAWIIANDN
jgi:hypothetical protein